MTEVELLRDAAWALDVLGHGGDPGYAVLASGISSLEVLQNESPLPMDQSLRDLMAAAQDLLELANESDLPFDTDTRARAVKMAYVLGKYAEQL